MDFMSPPRSSLRLYLQEEENPEFFTASEPIQRRRARNFSKLQNLKREGELGIFPSPRAQGKSRNFSKTQETIRTVNFRQQAVFEGGGESGIFLSPRGYMGGGTRNFSMSQSPKFSTYFFIFFTYLFIFRHIFHIFLASKKKEKSYRGEISEFFQVPDQFLSP